jgi:hypothetical protein
MNDDTAACVSRECLGCREKTEVGNPVALISNEIYFLRALDDLARESLFARRRAERATIQNDNSDFNVS